MLVQSGGGKVYAIIANNEEFELGLMPSLQIMSTTVFLSLRCRFKSLATDHFDPLLVPKNVLVGGIERSHNTLRGTVMLNTGFTLDKIGAGFPEIVTKKVIAAAPGFLLPQSMEQEAAALYSHEMRDDFLTDFQQLVVSAIAPVYPPKDFSGTPALMNAFDLMLYTEGAQAPKSPFEAVQGGLTDQPPVAKVAPLGGDAVPTPAPPEPEGVDNAPNDPPIMGADIVPLNAPQGDEEPTPA